jgi:glycerol-3-phosphate acyltransferase PlsY
MDDMALSIAWVVGSYLLGSVPVGLLLAKARGADPRKVGSGNIGATNVMRAAGKSAGIITLLCDILKGFIPVCLAIHTGQAGGVAAAAGLAVFAGHLFPLYLKFRGGKGVATALGVFLALGPLAVCIVLAVFLAVFLAGGYVSLGSICAAALMPFVLAALGAPPSYVAACAIMAVMIIVKHRENIKRLFAGKEHRVLRRGRN